MGVSIFQRRRSTLIGSSVAFVLTFQVLWRGVDCSRQPTRRSYPMLMSSNLFTSSVQPVKGPKMITKTGKTRKEAQEELQEVLAFSPTFHHYHCSKLVLVKSPGL